MIIKVIQKYEANKLIEIYNKNQINKYLGKRYNTAIKKDYKRFKDKITIRCITEK